MFRTLIKNPKSIMLIRDAPSIILRKTFPHVQHLILDKCDKNFVFYNASPLKFPNLRVLMTNSDLCEAHVLYRDQNCVKYLTENIYKRYMINKYTGEYYEDNMINSINSNLFDEFVHQLILSGVNPSTFHRF